MLWAVAASSCRVKSTCQGDLPRYQVGVTPVVTPDVLLP